MIYMKNKLHSGILIFMSALGSLVSLSAQLTDIAEKEANAHSAFQNGRYELALHHYNELKDIFRHNPEYQYYIGRCLLEMDKDVNETIDNLRFAALKGEKDDAWFFLGKAYHTNADYEKAVYAYKRFLKLGKRPAIKQLRVKEAMVLAENESNLLPVRNRVIAEKNNLPAIEELQPQTERDDRSAPADELEKSVEKEQEHEVAMAVPGDVNLTRALDLQLAADSLNRKAKTLRAGLKEDVTDEERSRLIAEIAHLEKNAHRFRKEADELFDTIQQNLAAEQAGDTVKPHEFIELKEEIDGIKVYQYKTDILNQHDSSESQKTDSTATRDKAHGYNGSSDEDLFFTGKKVYDKYNPIPPRIIVPDKLVYHIQLGVFSKKLDPDSFEAISPVYYEEMKDRGLFKYYAGLFFTYSSAGEAHKIVKSRGYPDSFVVAFHEGIQISVDKARQIEYVQIKF